MADLVSASYPANALYPDIDEAGGLVSAITPMLTTISPFGSRMEIYGSRYHADIACELRSVQVTMNTHERLFSLDFWNNRVLHGMLSTGDLSDVAYAIRTWIADHPTPAEMQRHFPKFKPIDYTSSDKRGGTIEFRWASLYAEWKEAVSYTDPTESPLYLIEAAMKAPALRQLYPCTSLYRLCFSRIPRSIGLDECPHALPLGNGRYRACSAEYRIEKRTSDVDGKEYDAEIHEILGEGTAEEVIALIVANLPPECGPAVDGTADTIGTDR